MKFPRWLAVGALLVFIVLLASPALFSSVSDTTAGASVLVGYVSDSGNGTPVSGAIINVYGLSHVYTVTDTEGYFIITEVPDDGNSYTVNIAAAGYHTTDVNMSPGVAGDILLDPHTVAPTTAGAVNIYIVLGLVALMFVALFLPFLKSFRWFVIIGAVVALVFYLLSVGAI